ncbi:MAG: CHAT domain-containing protein [Armatimonadota bacterium]|nr:CHAT domain-containing protein [Armatimonadota bacterium]
MRFLRERFGDPCLEVAEHLKDLLDRLAHHRPQQALQRARELADYAEAGADPTVRVVARLAVANALLWCERLEEAHEAYEAARRLADAHGQPHLAARCGVGRMGVLFRQGRYREALELADLIEPVLAAHPKTCLFAARVRAQRATLLQYLGDTEAALLAYAQAADQFRTLGESANLDLAVVQHNAGLLLAQLGRHAEAAQALQEATRRAEAAGSSLLALRSAAATAWSHVAQGRYAHALQALEEVADRYREAGVPAAAAAYRLFALECRLYLGQADRVTREGRHLAHELDAAGFIAEAARARYLAAVACRQRGDLHAAGTLLQQALAALDRIGRQPWRAAAACELAAVRSREGNTSEAVALADQAYRSWVEVGSPAGTGRALLVRSDAYLLLQDTATALQSAREALRLGQQHRMAWLCAAAHRRLSVLRPPRRSGHLLSGVRWADRMLAWLPADLRSGVFAELGELYAASVLELWGRGRWVRAWEVVQSAKSRGMAWLLASHGLRVRPRDPASAHLVQELNRLLEAHRRGVFAELDPGEPHFPGQPAEADLESRVRDLLWRLQLQDPAYASEAPFLMRTLRPALPDLDSDTALVEYFVAGDHVLVFVLEPDGHVLCHRACGTREVARVAALWANGLRAHATGQLSTRQAVRQARRVLQDLHSLLVAPVEPRLRPYRRLVVAPFGLLHGLPFHACHDGHAHVWDRWEVGYVPAGSLLPLLQKRPMARGPAVCVADGLRGQLPGAVAEARWVARRLGGRLYESPSPDQLLAAVRDAKLVHVAAHCRFRPEAPLLSAIHLAAGPVTAADVLAAEAGCGIVVLSGCETASSRVLPGDELVGFTRAWLHAGARAVVVSLWPVHDGSTAQFMQQLYDHLARGARIPDALRSAGLQLRARWEHPWYWAGFVVVGDPQARLVENTGCARSLDGSLQGG